ncbi:DUF4365 domain-containing protein [Streptomyces laurentii]|uniref:DUF4365 domain-containing protein n=1 Tax=Streptomyces laurentii TaxID=39478 RepID=UPI0036C998F2
MALAQPESGGLPPQREALLRGSLATTACMETLQVGYLHAVAAAAGCSLSQPFPDNGIDWHLSHSAPGHTVDDEVTIKVQLKCTYQIAPRVPGTVAGTGTGTRAGGTAGTATRGTAGIATGATAGIATAGKSAAFSFTLDNEHLVKLARTPVAVHKILVVMLVPRNQEDWLRAGHDRLDLRHCCYWINLAGHPVTGRRRTTVRVPTTRIFDDRALCEIMARVGVGGRP